MLRLALYLFLLAEAAACAPAGSPAASAVPHGATSAPVGCPNLDPAQANCKTPADYVSPR